MKMIQKQAALAPALEALRVNVIVGRARFRLSQSELATLAGVSRPTISRIERASGDVGVEIVGRIAAALKTTVSEIFYLDRSYEVDDDEILRRSRAPDSEFIDAEDLFKALAEADRPIERYS